MVKYCGKCGAEVSDESLFCPECKAFIKRDDAGNTSNIKWILIGVAIVFLIVAAGIFMSDTSSKVSTSLTMISSSNLDSGQYQVLLTDESNNNLADKYITLEAGNTSYKLKTNGEGVASINLTLTKGSHEVSSYFRGDDYYEESHTSDIIII